MRQIWLEASSTTAGVQIRGPQADGIVQDLPVHLYDLGGYL